MRDKGKMNTREIRAYVVIKGISAWQAAIKTMLNQTGNPLERVRQMEAWNAAIKMHNVAWRFEEFPEQVIQRYRNEVGSWYKGN